MLIDLELRERVFWLYPSANTGDVLPYFMLLLLKFYFQIPLFSLFLALLVKYYIVLVCAALS